MKKTFYTQEKCIITSRDYKLLVIECHKILLRDRCCDINVPSKHATSQDKICDIKDRFCEELVLFFDHCPKYNMKFLLGEFNAKLGREDFQTDSWE